MSLEDRARRAAEEEAHMRTQAVEAQRDRLLADLRTGVQEWASRLDVSVNDLEVDYVPAYDDGDFRTRPYARATFTCDGVSLEAFQSAADRFTVSLPGEKGVRHIDSLLDLGKALQQRDKG